MDFVLKLRGGVIAGRSRLEQRDPVSRTARGAFRPGLGYELIEPIFALAHAPEAGQRARFAAARDTLAIELWLGDASFEVDEVAIDPGSGDGLTLSIRIRDDAFWQLAPGGA